MSPRALEFVCVGHVTIDRVDGEERLGGAAAYAAITASSLGLRVALWTKARSDFPFRDALSDVELHGLDAEDTTVFENHYDEGGRRTQRVRAVAPIIETTPLARLTDRLATDAAVMYCPVAHEISGRLVRLAPKGLSVVAPQGFCRAWDAVGNVRRTDWTEASRVLADADIVSASEEDLSVAESENLARAFEGTAFAITRGAAGARVYSSGRVMEVPGFEARVVDPTGAGDVFAAALTVALREDSERDVLGAAKFASAAASLAVEGMGTGGIAPRQRVMDRLRQSKTHRAE